MELRRVDDGGDWGVWPAGEWHAVNDGVRATLQMVMENTFTVTRGSGDKEREEPFGVGSERLALTLAAAENAAPADGFLDWLEGLPAWDGVGRLRGALGACFAVDETTRPMAEAVSEYILLGAVARAYEPGCKLDETPVLSGAQGMGKSTYLFSLFPEPLQMAWHTDSLDLKADDKAKAEALQGRVLVELAEVAGLAQAQMESLKAFLTRRDDSVRLAYRRDRAQLLRRAVFVGTTNEAAPLPNDRTGNRRWVLVRLQGGDPAQVRAYLAENRLQMWAEALAAHRAGREARLPQELLALQAELNEYGRRLDETMEEPLRAWAAAQTEPFKLLDAARHVGVVRDEFRQTEGVNAVPRGGSADDRSQHRVENALRLLGYRRGRKRAGGKYWWNAPCEGFHLLPNEEPFAPGAAHTELPAAYEAAFAPPKTTEELRERLAQC